MIAFDRELGQFYARALVAIARADGVIDAGQGARLERCLTARLNEPVALAELLFEPPLRVSELPAIFESGQLAQGPFRSTQIDRREIAEMFLADALVVVGDALEAKVEVVLVRIAKALGLSPADIAKALGR